MTTSVLSRVRAREGLQLRTEAAVSRYVSETRAEPGSIAIAAYRSPDLVGMISILSAFRNGAALDWHRQTPHWARFQRDMAECAEGGAADIVPLSAIAPPTLPPAGQARGLDHVGVVVPDLDAASQFLITALGAATLYDLAAGQAAEGRVRMLRLGRSAGIRLIEAPAAASGPVTLGVYVDDLDAAAARFRQAGGHFLAAPQPLTGIEAGEGHFSLRGQTPWGLLIDLVCYPDGIDHPDGTPMVRWTPPLQRG